MLTFAQLPELSDVEESHDVKTVCRIWHHGILVPVTVYGNVTGRKVRVDSVVDCGGAHCLPELDEAARIDVEEAIKDAFLADNFYTFGEGKV